MACWWVGGGRSVVGGGSVVIVIRVGVSAGPETVTLQLNYLVIYTKLSFQSLGLCGFRKQAAGWHHY